MQPPTHFAPPKCHQQLINCKVIWSKSCIRGIKPCTIKRHQPETTKESYERNLWKASTFLSDAVPEITEGQKRRQSKRKVSTKQDRLKTNWNLCLPPIASNFFAVEMYMCLAQDSGKQKKEIHGS